MNKKNADAALYELKKLAEELEISDISNVLLDNPRFIVWSGSGSKGQHHFGTFGLLIHTEEVVAGCFAMMDTFPQYNIDPTELFLSALFHDSGKMFDYDNHWFDNNPNFAKNKNDNNWRSTDHKRLIHHISRSALIWNDAVKEHPELQKYADPVLHAILSHHGRREWGSPVAPKSRVAWLLHLCDGISARLHDTDTMDRF